MPELLLELLSEEIPARMQRKAADDLRKLVTDALVERGLVYEGAKAFATPRRLALHVAGLPIRGSDIREERKGPRVGAPDAAVQGFLKASGLTSLDQATIVSDPPCGIASRAFTARLTIAISSWCASTRALGRSSGKTVCTSIIGPSVRWSMSRMPSSRSRTSTAAGLRS